MDSNWDAGQHEGWEAREGRQVEETLRMVARMPVPDGLEERVQRRLDVELLRGEQPRHSVWSLWMPARKLQFAGAGVLAAAVAISSWSVYHGQRRAANANAAAKQAAPAPAKSTAGSGFTPAGAVGVPHTLAPIHVAPAPKRKPDTASTKPSPKKIAHPAQATP
jgi:hypothetical protein